MFLAASEIFLRLARTKETVESSANMMSTRKASLPEATLMLVQVFHWAARPNSSEPRTPRRTVVSLVEPELSVRLESIR